MKLDELVNYEAGKKFGLEVEKAEPELFTRAKFKVLQLPKPDFRFHEDLSCPAVRLVFDTHLCGGDEPVPFLKKYCTEEQYTSRGFAEGMCNHLLGENSVLGKEIYENLVIQAETDRLRSGNL